MTVELHKNIISKMLELRSSENFDEEIVGWYDKEIMPKDKRSIIEIIFEDIHVEIVGYKTCCTCGNCCPQITPLKAEEIYTNDQSLYWEIIQQINDSNFDVVIVNTKVKLYKKSIIENDDPSCDNCGKFVDERSLHVTIETNRLICPSCAIDIEETE